MRIVGNTWRRLNYTAMAPVYNLIARPLAPLRRRSIEMLALTPGERVLMVGAGTGLDLDHLPRDLSITATDLTPAMLGRLRRRARRLSLPVDAHVMDARALSFANASFDVAILHLILAIVPDPVACIREVARVLRPGGRTVILDKFAPDGPRIPMVLRLGEPLLNAVATHVTRQLGPIVEASGLELVQNVGVGPAGFFRIALLRKPATPHP